MFPHKGMGVQPRRHQTNENLLLPIMAKGVERKA